MSHKIIVDNNSVTVFIQGEEFTLLAGKFHHEFTEVTDVGTIGTLTHLILERELVLKACIQELLK